MYGQLTHDRPIAIAPGFRLQWKEAQSAHVLLYPEGMVRIGASAGTILKRYVDRMTQALRGVEVSTTHRAARAPARPRAPCAPTRHRCVGCGIESRKA